MKTNIYHILFFTITPLLFIGCQKKTPDCTDGKDVYYNLSDSDKAKIPYTGTETLVFISNTGDTSKLFCQGKQDFYNSYSLGGNPDCYMASAYSENMNFTFTSTNSNLSNYIYAPGIYNTDPPISSDVHFSINNMTFESMGLSYFSNPANYSDTTYINNVIYYGRKLNRTIQNGQFLTIDSTNTIFYKYPKGIIKIKFSNNQIWLKQ